ncbi:hypothetical protein [Streptomyces mirabilis]
MTATATEPTAPDSPLPVVPTDWRVTSEGTVRVSDVARTVGDYESVNYTVRRCGVPVASQHGQGGARYIHVREALLILAAATVAVAAGIALAAMYRALKATATITDTSVVIPLGTAA